MGSSASISAVNICMKFVLPCKYFAVRSATAAARFLASSDDKNVNFMNVGISWSAGDWNASIPCSRKMSP